MIAELEQFPVTGGERTQGGISYHNEKHPESLKEMEALATCVSETVLP